jgi:hypothetical protein
MKKNQQNFNAIFFIQQKMKKIKKKTHNLTADKKLLIF